MRTSTAYLGGGHNGTSRDFCGGTLSSETQNQVFLDISADLNGDWNVTCPNPMGIIYVGHIKKMIVLAVFELEHLKIEHVYCHFAYRR
jgi:hypothetical protein